MKLEMRNTTFKKTLILLSLVIAIAILCIPLYIDNHLMIKEINSLAVANRSINTYFAAIITAMVFIITLTSNVYSPHLIKLYVSHPITIAGVSYILLTNLIIVTTHLITKNHPSFELMSLLSFSLTIIAMLGLMPYLYLLSRYARPSFFIPLMSRDIIHKINMIHRDNSALNEKRIDNIFYQIDVMNNMASSAIQRKDKTVISIVYTEIFHILNRFIELNFEDNLDRNWRLKYSKFSHGTSQEGKYYLKKDKIWPETYLLAKILENINHLKPRDNEIIPYICRLITNTNEKCILLQYDKLVRFNLMILNTLLSEGINTRNQQKASSIFYYYRINIELLSDHWLCKYALENFILYGKKCLHMNEVQSIESFLFDLSRIIHYLSFEGEENAFKHYNTLIRPTWKLFLKEDQYKSIVQKSIVKSFWNLYSQNYSDLTSDIRHQFLKDNFQHARILYDMIINKGPIRNEYSDNIINPEYLTGMAYSLAKDFLSEFMNDFEKEFEEAS